MSAGLLGAVDVMGTARRARAWREEMPPRCTERWDPEKFAEEQVRGLVRQVFLAGTPRPARQVVFSAIDAGTDVHWLCRRVGETLASERTGDVAVVGVSSLPMAGGLAGPENVGTLEYRDSRSPLKKMASRISRNCWLLRTAEQICDRGESLQAYLGQIRQEFEYSVLAASPAGESDEATAMAQSADGIILVLSAERTRRAAALKVKEAMDGAQLRILGTVLSDREFPIPQRLYQRL